MPVSYEYSIGSVRAKEKELLSSSDIEAMLACKSVSELKTFLGDKGYSGNSIDEMLKSSRDETFEYLKTIVPDISVFDLFLYVNDAHNVKSIVKGMLADVDYEGLILSPYTIEPEAIETAVKERKYSLLPEWISQAAEKAYEILAKTADARLADAYIDKAAMEARIAFAKETKIQFLIDYVNIETAYFDYKIALRASALNASADYYEAALCGSVEGLDCKELVKAALKGSEKLIEYLGSKDVYFSKKAVSLYKKSSSEFEKFYENLLMNLAVESCRRSGSGAEAAIGYYLGKAAEEKAVHIISVGIETQASAELTRERLREIYG